jgi:hypothetical protein
MDEEWYSALPLEMRAAYELLWAKCDAAGVWTVNHRLAEFHIGKKVDWKSFIQKTEGRIVELDARRYFLREFISTNCGTLSKDCRAHNHVFSAIERNKIPSELMCSDSYPIAIGKDKEQEQEEEKEPEKEKTANKARGTLDELGAFCLEIGLHRSDGEACFHKWVGNGWKNGGEPIKCWRSTIRAWQKNGYLPSQRNGFSGGQQEPKIKMV